MNRAEELQSTIDAATFELREILHERELRQREGLTDDHQPEGRMGLLVWLLGARPQHLLSVPFIYAMAVPLALLDLSLSLYQAVCFRLYGIALVRRRDHFQFDRHRLNYLNAGEKLNCLYCGYANGLMSFAREIVSRTEQYWCPIKHSRHIEAAPPRHADFIDYGDAHNYHARVERLRAALRGETPPPPEG